ncbi:hypothetical protein GC209_03055 [bacterium]|nr:hypothetical protein [bacterium]
MLSRFLALLIGTLALAALRGQFDAMADLPVATRLWLMAAYFSVLTNLGVAVLMFVVARGGRIGSGVAAAMLVAVGIVAAAQAVPGFGPATRDASAFWPVLGLRAGVPFAAGLWWLQFADKTQAWRNWRFLMLWPALYCACVLVRLGVFGYDPDLWPGGDLLGAIVFVRGLALHLLAIWLAWFGG